MKAGAKGDHHPTRKRTKAVRGGWRQAGKGESPPEIVLSPLSREMVSPACLVACGEVRPSSAEARARPVRGPFEFRRVVKFRGEFLVKKTLLFVVQGAEVLNLKILSASEEFCRVL